MEHTPPPFFRRGPAPIVRLAFFASLSLALLIIDARFRYFDGLRSALATVAYPLQEVALAPADLAGRLTSYFATQSKLRAENATLRAKLLAESQIAQRYQAAAVEAVRLRRLIGAADRLAYRNTPAEIVYTARDPFAQTVIIGKGTEDGVKAGDPVVDDTGVLGQVIRAYPFLAEVRLVTDKDLAVPVQVARNGLRAIAFGAGGSGMMALRYLAPNVEVEPGDRLVTSGIGGTYPPGLPVATVVSVERDSTHAFARIVCQPAATVQRGRFVLVLSNQSRLPPYPRSAHHPTHPSKKHLLRAR